jgi:membrane protease YdiL (CAAX protease family)
MSTLPNPAAPEDEGSPAVAHDDATVPQEPVPSGIPPPESPLPAETWNPEPHLAERQQQRIPFDSAPIEPIPEIFREPPYEWYRRPLAHSPSLVDVGLLVLLVGLGWLGSGLLLAVALHFHAFGITTLKQAIVDIHYTLGTQAALYLIAFGGCLILFPAIWQRGFFDGLEWRGAVALRQRRLLGSATTICFLLALLDGILIPGPPDTPIDQIFRTPGAAWLLFGFGITLAPFFEEIAYRGFLLPALCSACDWTVERFTGSLAPQPDENGQPRWSTGAMVAASLLTSVPFALMHAEQTGYSLGPFLLLVCVSLVLSWVRLHTRSLAASVVVHSCYNLLLFSLMLAGTGGFKHLEKM